MKHGKIGHYLVNKKADEDLKKEMLWKNNLFSRYILFRYSIALFFFANIYWLMITVYFSSLYAIFPLGLIIVLALASVEQFRLYGEKKVRLTWTKRSFQLQRLVNLLMICLLLLPKQFSLIFPIFADNSKGKSFIAVLQCLSLLLIWLNQHHLEQIEKKSDKFYDRFQKDFGKLL